MLSKPVRTVVLLFMFKVIVMSRWRRLPLLNYRRLSLYRRQLLHQICYTAACHLREASRAQAQVESKRPTELSNSYRCPTLSTSTLRTSPRTTSEMVNRWNTLRGSWQMAGSPRGTFRLSEFTNLEINNTRWTIAD